ncbi:MAG: peptide methionine sulfoxide reductase MsrA [Porticoccaceae bacterium]|nr:MAG: peptide methionine sulfoxide reductase MsrA [Porticoccaceae bacterium]
MIAPVKLRLPNPDEALPDRPRPIVPRAAHAVLGRPLTPPFPEDSATILFGMGCFWGAERLFWRQEGVWVTAVGYAGGITANPRYEDVCSGLTGHAEVVLVVYRPAVLSLDALLALFWENHDPTQGMRQGNDVGTQYRSAIYCGDDASWEAALASRERFAACLAAAGFGPVTTEIRRDVPFYYAEEYHQQYLAKNPGGYCGLAGTGVAYPRAAEAGR